MADHWSGQKPLATSKPSPVMTDLLEKHLPLFTSSYYGERSLHWYILSLIHMALASKDKPP